MNKDLEKDLFKTHGILNYLNAGYQAKFSYFNILSQLGAQVPAEEMSKTKASLDKIIAWLDLLWKGEPLFAATWDKPETFDAQKAIDFLEQLIPDLDVLSKKLVQILSIDGPLTKPADIQILIAALGRHAYSRDNYIRGFVDFGKQFKKPEMASEYSTVLPDIAEEISLVHSFLNTFRQSQKEDLGFLNRVRYEAMRLPGGFRMHMHDIRQLVLPYRGIPFNFDKFEIPEDRAAIWKQLNVSPALAGYWEAHFISPQEAAGWSQLGIIDFNVAAAWKTHGFNPSNAQTWVADKLSPFDSMLWFREGFDSKTAKENIDQGTVDPRQVPKPSIS